MVDNLEKLTTADANQETAAAAKVAQTVSDIFGQATWLMTQSRGHRNMFISDLEWMLMPAILLRQFRLFPGKNQPLGIALWAQLSDDVSQRLETGGRLKPEDWKSGSNLWLVELLAPFGQQEAMINDLKGSIFKGKQFKMHATDKDGVRRVITMAGDGASAPEGQPGPAGDTAAAPEVAAADDTSADKTIN